MIRYFAAHPTAANLVMLAFMVAGLAAAPTLQRETFPRIEPSQVEVQVIYPAARPEDIEEAVCQRIEDALDSVNGVREVICEAREGLARATVEMIEGGDLDRLTADVKTEVEAIDDFPEQIEKPTVRQLGRTDFVASVAVTGIASKPDLKAYAEALKTRMLRWGGIPKVEITGFSDHQIRIEVADATLRQFGLSVADVAAAVQRQSLDLPSGSIQASDRELLIRFADERKRVFEFLDLVVISGAGGGQIRLGDIAQVTDRFDLDEEKIVFNGQPAAVLQVSKTENEDTLTVIDRLQAFLEVEAQEAPPAISLVVTNDISSIVRDRLNLLVRNGLQGLFLVFVTLWLVFGLRYSFWVAMGLPVSFLGAVALMILVDYSINMLTMVGLLIVIGLLMDDAIVIAENISARRQQGRKPLEAAVEGARQVFPSVFASFATTTCIFGSLAFLQGDLGQILRVVPVVMLFVLVISLVEAFLVLPHHLLHALEGGGGPGRVQAAVERGLGWMRERLVGPLAELAVSWRYLTLGCAIALLLLAVSAMAGGLLKFSAFPDLDGDVVEARILLPQGTPLARTEKVVAAVEAALARVDQRLTPEQPEGQALLRNVAIKFNQNQDAHESGPHVATITADLLESSQRSSRVDDIIALWRAETGDLPDVLSIKFTEPQVGPAGLAIDIRLQGEDLSELKAASLALQGWLAQYRGAFNITDDLRPGKPEVRIRLQDGAAPLGVDSRMIADQLRSAFFGTTVDEIQVGGESFEIDLRLAQKDRDSLADLDDFTIATASGALIPLSAVADLELGRGYSRIKRVDGLRTVTVQGDVDTALANANEIIADTQARFFPTLLADFPGVRLALEGENKEAGTTQQSMVKGFVLGLIGVYLLLSFQFRSFVEPLVVMIIIPFAFIGAVVGHLLLGLDFTMPSMLGFVALGGVVVNDSILLVNFIKHYHGDTQSVAEAAPLASRARFRAILLTSVTTIVGLLPLLAETSLQAQVLIPLVTSLAFGLLASTLPGAGAGPGGLHHPRRLRPGQDRLRDLGSSGPEGLLEEAQPVAAGDLGHLLVTEAGLAQGREDGGKIGRRAEPGGPVCEVGRGGQGAFPGEAPGAPPGDHLGVVAGVVVGAEADVVDAEEIHGPGQHVAEALEGLLGAALGQPRIEREPDHAAALGHRLQQIARLVAPLQLNLVADEGLGVGVGDGDRPLGELDGIQAAARAAVGQVDQHTDLVHLAHQVAAEEGRETVVLVLPIARGDQVLDVVGELGDAHPQVMEAAHQIDVVLEGRAVLEAEDHGGAPRLGDGLDLPRAAGQGDQIAVGGEEPVPLADHAQGLPRVLPDGQGDVNATHLALAPFQEAGALGLAVLQGIDDQGHDVLSWLGRLLPALRISLTSGGPFGDPIARQAWAAFMKSMKTRSASIRAFERGK